MLTIQVSEPSSWEAYLGIYSRYICHSIYGLPNFIFRINPEEASFNDFLANFFYFCVTYVTRNRSPLPDLT